MRTAVAVLRLVTRIVRADSGSGNRRQNEEMIPVNRLTPTVWADPSQHATTYAPALLTF